MRTTLDLNDALLRAAKRKAAEEGRTLTSVVEDALRDSLQLAKRPARPFKLELHTVKGKLRPGVDLDSRAALYDLLDGLD